MTSFDPRKSKQPEGNNGLLIAAFVAVAFMMGWDYFAPKNTPAVTEVSSVNTVTVDGNKLPGQPEVLTQIGEEHSVQTAKTENHTIRLPLESDSFSGGVALTGGRIDDLSLKNYTITLNGDETVKIFSPSGKRVHFFDAGWQSVNTPVPVGNTTWQAKGTDLTAQSPLVLSWQNDQGQEFIRTFSLDEKGYAIRVVDEVINRSSQDIQVGHYAQIHKSDGLESGGEGYEEEMSTFYNFIGPEGIIEGIKYEHDYDDIKKEKFFKYTGEKGWLAVKSRYFLAAILPDQQTENTWQFKHNKIEVRDFYSAIVQAPIVNRVAANGGSFTKSYRLYVGPNNRQEMAKEGIGLEDSVDYGWYQAIALPIYSSMMFFYDYTGNLGLAIIIVTILLKILLLPLANKSYKSMARMKQLTPKIEDLKERLGDNREQMGLEMMKLYKEHKVNPASGCWPMLVQIPIFFAFYKVILISFEFRHEPFMLWIHDLSAHDPFFILPLLMGASMWFQQKLNPPATDPIQRQVMQALPIIFTIMFAMFPSGLVLYWFVNNVVSIAQQWFITKRIEKAGL
jgi:YidC/Oxa1 family membrane protein insertase